MKMKLKQIGGSLLVLSLLLGNVLPIQAQAEEPLPMEHTLEALEENTALENLETLTEEEIGDVENKVEEGDEETKEEIGESVDSQDSQSSNTEVISTPGKKEEEVPSGDGAGEKVEETTQEEKEEGYEIEVIANGASYEISKEKGKEGDTITISAVPQINYHIRAMAAYDENKSRVIQGTTEGDILSFTMPGEKITIEIFTSPNQVEGDAWIQPARSSNYLSGDVEQYVGKVVTGSAWIGGYISYGVPLESYFDVSGLEELGYSGSVSKGSGLIYCRNRGAGEPSNMQADLWAECTRIEGGYAYYNLILTPPGATNAAIDTGWDYMSGYQKIGSKAFAVPVTESKGKVSLKKTSDNEGLTKNHPCYSLAEAVYGVYSDSGLSSEEGLLVTDDYGNTNSLDVKAGTYYVKELTPSKGYFLDPKTYTVQVKAGQEAVVYSIEKPQNDPISIMIRKIDKDTGKESPLGKGTLEDAQFTVKYYAGEYNSLSQVEGLTPTKTWVLKTNKNGNTLLLEKYKISGDDFYKVDGKIIMPMGAITIQETKAPEGYLIDDTVHFRAITPEGRVEGVSTFQVPIVKEQVIRGDVRIKKRGEINIVKDDLKRRPTKPLKDIKFHFTSKTNGEKYIITTDENGEASTTQLGNQENGNLPYDDYVVTEECPYPEYHLMKPFEISINEQDEELEYTIVNEIIDASIRIIKKDKTTGKIIPMPGVKFQILDEKKNVVKVPTSKILPVTRKIFVTDEEGSVTLPAKLPYGNYYLQELQAPRGYVLNQTLIPFEVKEEGDEEKPIIVTCEDQPGRGKIHITKRDEETIEVLPNTIFEIRAEEDIQTPDGSIRAKKGDLVETVTTNSKGIAISKELYLGKYVVTEKKQVDGYVLSDKKWDVELAYENQEVPVVIKEILVENKPTTLKIKKVDKESQEPLQGVTFKIWSQAMEEKEYQTDTNGEIVIKNLVPGEYFIQEVKPLIGYMKNEETTTFTIDEKGKINGKEEEEVVFDNVKTKLIGTTAKDQDTGKKEGFAVKQATIIDTVAFQNLTVGQTYVIKGKLMNKTTQLPLLANGKEVTAEKTFTAKEKDGTVDMTFTFDASALRGATIVVFEKVYEDDMEILAHEDLNDVDQTVEYPDIKIRTTAKNPENHTKEVIAKKDTTIVDTVKYENLIVGETYTVRGILMEKESLKPLLVNGKEVTAEKTFTAEEKDGTVDMTFTFDASALKGATIVVFEKLMVNEKEVATHEDIHDEGQTIQVKLGSLKVSIPNQKGRGKLSRMIATKTGDSIQIWQYLFTIILSGMIIFAGWKRRKA